MPSRRQFLGALAYPAALALAPATLNAQRLMLQRGYELTDLRFLVENGKIKAPATKPANLWRYRVDGKSVEGRKMSAMFEMDGKTLTLCGVL